MKRNPNRKRRHLNLTRKENAQNQARDARAKRAARQLFNKGKTNKNTSKKELRLIANQFRVKPYKVLLFLVEIERQKKQE